MKKILGGKTSGIPCLSLSITSSISTPCEFVYDKPLLLDLPHLLGESFKLKKFEGKGGNGLGGI